MSKIANESFRPSWLAAAAASVFLALPAQATVVLDTFGPGDAAGGSAWSLYSSAPSGQFLAVPFTLQVTSTITDILTSIDGFGNFNLGIVAGAGLPIGAYAFSTVLTDPVANSAASGLSWTLAAGDYWLVSRPDAESFGTWAGGLQTSDSPWAFTFQASDSDWSFTGNFDAPAARITVTPIPEPGTWALMLGGLALCGAAVSRRRG